MNSPHWSNELYTNSDDGFLKNSNTDYRYGGGLATKFYMTIKLKFITERVLTFSGKYAIKNPNGQQLLGTFAGNTV